MSFPDILKNYKELVDSDIQLNVGTFKMFYEDLIKALLKEKEGNIIIKKINKIYNDYLLFRDGCEMNNLTIKRAISDIEKVLI